MDSGILGLVTLTACTNRPGDMDVRSFCRAFFKFSSIWSGGFRRPVHERVLKKLSPLTKQLNVDLLQCVRTAELCSEQAVV